MIGRTISRFRITEKLGEGGMEVVHRDIKPGNAILTDQGRPRS